MDLETIKALPVPAAGDCVLFLWATVPMLPQALEVVVAWGFEYRSHCIWHKDKVGLGYWFRNRHELLLVGTRGNIPAPGQGEQAPSVIEAPRALHSEKPVAFAEMIERLYPNVPKLEMFARAPRAGWDAWGDEVGDAGHAGHGNEVKRAPRRMLREDGLLITAERKPPAANKPPDRFALLAQRVDKLERQVLALERDRDLKDNSEK